jgi:hypothetical protein
MLVSADIDKTTGNSIPAAQDNVAGQLTGRKNSRPPVQRDNVAGGVVMGLMGPMWLVLQKRGVERKTSDGGHHQESKAPGKGQKGRSAEGRKGAEGAVGREREWVALRSTPYSNREDPRRDVTI